MGKFKNVGTIQKSSWPFEKMPLLYFDYVKTADFGSEKKISITIFHEKKLPFSVAPFILQLNHSKRAFVAVWWLEMTLKCLKCSV